MKTQRVKSVDVAGGILILWVMAFHAINQSKAFGEVDARVALPFLTFSMPWFFYKSGLFFKTEISNRDGFVKDVKKLVIPFLKWSLIGYAMWLAIKAVDGVLSVETALIYPLETFGIYGYIPVDVPAWFMLSLFFVRVISRYLIHRSVNPIIIIAVCVSGGFILHLLDNPLPFYVPNILMGIAFFMAGYRFGRHEKKRWLFGICLVGYLAFQLFGCSIVGHHRNILLTGYYLLWPLFAYTGIVAFNNICRLIDAAISGSVHWKHRPIAFVGEHTITLLVAHALVYYPVIHYSPLTPWQTVGVIFAGYILVFTPVLLIKRKKQQA